MSARRIFSSPASSFAKMNFVPGEAAGERGVATLALSGPSI